jgi:hypothetical protein
MKGGGGNVTFRLGSIPSAPSMPAYREKRLRLVMLTVTLKFSPGSIVEGKL